MAEFQIRGQVNLSTAGNGDGDPLLARDATTGAVGINSTALTASLSAGQLIVGNASNVATATTITGDVTINSSGVTAISSGVIVNADVNASAAIALTKLAATTASRVLVSDGSGVISPSAVTSTELGYVSGVTSAIQTQINAKQATITGAATTITSVDLTSNRALISSGAGKVAASSVTSTEIGYLSGVSSAIQTQINGKLSTTLTSPATGDIIYYNGAAWVNLPRGTNGQALYSTAGSIQWNTPTINGIPIGGTDGQVLAKQSSTDFDATWETLTVASIPEITATAAELNVLDGITATTSELNYIDGVTSAIQPQIDSKLSQTLAHNAIFVGNASNVATAYPAGSNGQVLTISGGVPTWQTLVGTGSVTSVAVSGGTTGLSTTGGPITTSGTITLTGTLVVANGGTGATDAAAARTNLGAIGGATGGTDNAILRADGTGGLTLQSSSILIDDSGNITTPNAFTIFTTGGTAGIAFSNTDSRVILAGGASGIDLYNGSTEITGSSNKIVTVTSTTNTAAGLSIRHETSATPAIGIGAAIGFEAETAAGNFELGASIQAVTTDVSAGSEDFRLDFKLMAAGAGATTAASLSNNGDLTLGGSSLTGHRTITTAGSGSNDLLLKNSDVDGYVRISRAGLAEQSPYLILGTTSDDDFQNHIITTQGTLGVANAPLHCYAVTHRWSDQKMNIQGSGAVAATGQLDYSPTSGLLTTVIGGVTYTYRPVLEGSAALNFPSTAAQTDSDLTIAVTGAQVGDEVSLGVPAASAISGGIFTAWVSATDTVTVRFSNYSSSAKDPANGTFKVNVYKN